MTAPCPSDLRLEGHLLDPAASGIGPHIAGCGFCRERLRRMEEEGEDFRRFVHPVTVDAVVAAARRPRPRLLGAAASAAAVAAVLVFFALRAPPPPDYVGGKGDGLGLTVFVGGAEGAWAATDGSAVSASAALRFQVRPAVRCHLWIVSVDASSQVSRLYPPQGDGGAEVSQAGPLPGGALLDGLGGPERIYAVCTARPLPLATLEALCRAAAGGGDRAVRRAGALAGLPAGALQASLLLEKRP